jgi:hypothetical protein
MSTEDEKIRIRLAEIMSSAGVGYNQISLEILYLLPEEFVQRYIWLWEKALGPAGSGDARGQQLAKDSELGKEKTHTDKKGNMIGAGAGGAGGGGKKFKRFGMDVRSLEAFEMKGRIDRRLRSIARDLRNFELEMRDREQLKDARRKGSGGRVGSGKNGSGGSGWGDGTAQCVSCGRIMDESWNNCPNDGTPIRRGKSGK